MILVSAALFLLAGVPQDPRHLRIPMEAGLTIVQVITGDSYQGRDYEAVISVADVNGRGTGRQDVSLTSAAFVKDRAGERRWLRVGRTVLGTDLEGARSLILGFDTDDAARLPGTTAVGPSRGLLDELRRVGRARVSVRFHAARHENTGTLELIEPAAAFPLLLNGARVRVPALHARARLEAAGQVHPWEFWFFDHPVQPLTLKAAHGATGAAAIGRPAWTRQVVRIDYPGAVIGDGDDEFGLDESAGELPEGDGGIAGVLGDRAVCEGDGLGGGTGTLRGGGRPSALGGGLGGGAGAGAWLERQLAANCRVPVPGIYFEFDSDAINPASAPWIRGIADLLRRHPDWAITIEGHTDSVGTARYNLGLSTRRAAALARSLTSQHGIASARLSTRGYGPDRPLESNATTEGRARNRRVELVRPCERPTR
jgi:hypothetical protein